MQLQKCEEGALGTQGKGLKIHIGDTREVFAEGKHLEPGFGE